MGEDDLMRVLLTSGLPIPAQRACLREQRVHIGFHPLASQSILTDLLAATLRTGLRLLSFVSTLVTKQTLAVFHMQCQRHVTVRAAPPVSTIAAKNVCSRPASVQEQDCLLPARQRGL